MARRVTFHGKTKLHLVDEGYSVPRFTRARCGLERPAEQGWYRDDGDPTCKTCLAILKAEPPPRVPPTLTQEKLEFRHLAIGDDQGSACGSLNLRSGRLTIGRGQRHAEIDREFLWVNCYEGNERVNREYLEFDHYDDCIAAACAFIATGETGEG